MFLYNQESGNFDDFDAVSLDVFLQILHDQDVVALHCLTKEDIDRMIGYFGSVDKIPDSFIWLDKYDKN